MAKRNPPFALLVWTYMSDAKFRRAFDNDPVKALKRLGFKKTPELEEALERLDLESLRRLSNSLGQARFC